MSKPPSQALPGAKGAIWLLVAINLFNYIDRQVLSAVVPEIKESLLVNPEHTGIIGFLMSGLTSLLGSNPTDRRMAAIHSSRVKAARPSV